MADLPILFSAPMVRGLIQEVERPGTGKTQTRRLLGSLRRFGRVTEFGPSDTPGYQWHFRDKDMRWHDLRHAELLKALRWSVGDRLWVRETVACGACAPGKPSHWAPSFWRRYQGTPKNPNGLWYQADDLAPERTITERGRWVPAIHMPRWASRLTLTVTDVRVQRLQECSKEDAAAEGLIKLPATGRYVIAKGDQYFDKAHQDPRIVYSWLWDEINGNGSWEANPWIVALTFTVERRNIDAARAA